MNTQRLVTELAFLGIKHVRDGTPYDWALPEYVALAKTGVRFNLLQVNPTAAAMTTVGSVQDVQRAAALEKAVPGSVESLEGANEYNISRYDLNGSNSYGNLPWGLADDRDLQSAVMADPVLAKVKVVAASTALVAAAPVVTPYVDASNWHVYGGVGQQLGAVMATGIAAARASAPAKPVYITETGISSSGYGSSSWGVADEATQAIIDTNVLLDGYKLGAARTFLYDLMDDTTNTPQENHFGLFRADGSAKPAATEISNLVKLLSDTDTAAAQPASMLGYSVSGLPATASSMLLQKADGTFNLVVWNGGATIYDGAKNVDPPVSAITVTFSNTQRNVSIYDPVGGLAALQSLSNARSVTFGLSKDPIVVSIVPPQPASPPTNTLVLKVSEDAWQGDAQFVVSVDGAKVGGVQTATALHGTSKPQATILTGTFGAGSHNVAVSFINDAYGGTPSTDRNLFVQSAAIDGTASSGGPAALFANGTATFNVQVPSSIAPTLDTLALHLSEDAWMGDAKFLISIDGKSLGEAQSVSALHKRGQMQDFVATGSFGAGMHDVAVSFTNDAWDGSEATDRNLYVNSIDFNGARVGDASATMLTTGTVHFQVGASPA